MIKKKKSHVPFRLNMLFFAVFLLFSALILRLGVVQIVHGEKFQKEVEKTENEIVNLPVPRGKIYDKNGNVIVDNKALNAITYTRARDTKQEAVLEVAETLATLIDMKTDKVTERDLKDFWMLKYPDEAKEKVQEELKKVENGEIELSSKEIYKLQIERITEKDLEKITEPELEVAAIFREMTKGYALVPQIVKNENVTPEEYAVVSENLENLPGVNTTTDWVRDYKYDFTLKSILGRISETDEGLPSEKLDYYLARGYNRNDRVGLSYLEAQYESVLHGQKAKVENVIKGNAVQETILISEGQRGSDLVLTIDMELQKAVEQILEEQMLAHKQMRNTQYLDRAFVVMMNPNTGEILSMAGKVYTKGEDGKMGFQDYALGTMNAAYEMGSTIKGATMLTGYDTGVIDIGSMYYDTPIRIKGTPTKSSWKNLGPTNDLKALEMSSNVYMFRTFLDLAGGRYVPGQSISIDYGAFQTARNYFSQFGLGVKTGIDLPGEASGYPGPLFGPGLLMDLAIGQYDTYTTLQLAQYVSTIANDGYRMQPKIVRQIHQPTMEENELGPIQKPFEPTVLNKVDIDQKYFDRVQQGFKLVFQGANGTARSVFAGKPYNPAGKTGTAQSFINGIEAVNSTLVGYAPFDNPEVAFAVVIPYAYYGNTSHNMNLKVGEAILDKYFELKEKRATQPQQETETTETPETTEADPQHETSTDDGEAQGTE
ncbi:penicillin-binding protein 2 [Fredinandcohnia sp. QZ13]|uniref:peptidoglycan D,D-transpeptidase FtsI family protein n=1 Tax=Fredinandcohnia sp. QZ13 TaxID=3073144 RepID=UPI0028532520|nr:penicillin-binding protein 2 [Fredinandcohnia sp. QZ13]MDR4888948.1 penicillin-binding protein 2 [Fredinandcohnia sp. QZ13]